MYADSLNAVLDEAVSVEVNHESCYSCVDPLLRALISNTSRSLHCLGHRPARVLRVPAT